MIAVALLDGWEVDAACAGQPGEWDLDGLTRAEAAARAAELTAGFCDRCPVTDVCYRQAIETRAYDTVRGGVQFGSSGLPVRAEDGLCRGGCGVAVDKVWCAVCRPARKTTPITHGTTAGAGRHRRKGEKPCAPCLEAENRRHAEREQARKEAA